MFSLVFWRAKEALSVWVFFLQLSLAYFSPNWICLFCRSIVFLVRQPRSLFPWRLLGTVFSETTFPDLAKSIRCLDSCFVFFFFFFKTHLSLIFFEILWILHLPGLFGTMWLSLNLLLINLTLILDRDTVYVWSVRILENNPQF